MARETLKTALVYLLSIGLLSYYGIQVCPFLESLPPSKLMVIHAVALAIGFACRTLLILRLHRGDADRPESREVDVDRPWKHLRIDLGCWLLIGLLVTAWNAAAYDFPVGSGMKVVLGCFTLGIFTATSLALDLEHQLIRSLADREEPVELKPGRFLSITTKFLLFIGLCIGAICLILLLLIYKDFQYVIERLTTSAPFEFTWIAREVLFVFGVLFLGTLLVLRKYSRNLRLMFELQLDALQRVGEGNYERFVPVVSHDEFSTIAERTNGMIVGLREKERIRRIFGKYVSVPVAREILEGEQGEDLGGREVEVTLLFTDLRNFTPFAERCSPREVVQILNEYFTTIVEAIHQHGGIVDKFIGDAALAVFGLGSGTDSSDAALRTALDIRRRLAEMNRSLTERGLPTLANGIGIHRGVVIAGNIGSRERMEFTVIGDAVNTASRLEQLTKELPSPLALSAEVYRSLDEAARNGLKHLGEYLLKGKSAPLPVYGLPD